MKGIMMVGLHIIPRRTMRRWIGWTGGDESEDEDGDSDSSEE